jgi:phospholipase A1
MDVDVEVRRPPMKTPSLVIALLAVVTTQAADPIPSAPPASAGKQTVADTNSPSQLYPTGESMKKLYQPYLRNLESYEPLYFLVGTDPSDSKFQLSLKYQLLNEDGSLAKRYPWATGFHFGYTQTSFWNLKAASAPFEDTSYKPELHFLSPNIDTGIPHVKGFFVQSGLQHESNGKDGDASRSTNFAYVKPIFVFYNETSKLGLMVAPKMWAYVANDSVTNPDLSDYRGYFDLEVKVGKADGLMLGSHLWWGDRGGSTLLDLTYPLSKWLGGNLDIYLDVQYVNALAENLLSYKERTKALRIGIALVR